MDVKEQARAYALKVLENELKKIEEAYILGYEQGQKDADPQPIIKEREIEWIDLSLPSGTLWSKPIKEDFEGQSRILKVPYNKVRNFSLPTEDDIIELLTETTVQIYGGHYPKTRIISRKGLKFEMTSNCWMKGETDDEGKTLYIDTNMNVNKRFADDLCEVILVKRKN